MYTSSENHDCEVLIRITVRLPGGLEDIMLGLLAKMKMYIEMRLEKLDKCYNQRKLNVEQ